MDLSSSMTFQNPLKINAGVRALEHLPFELTSAGVDRPFVIIQTPRHQRRLRKILTDAFKGSQMTICLYSDMGSTAKSHPVTEMETAFARSRADSIIVCGFEQGVTNAIDLRNRLLTKTTKGFGKVHRPSGLPLLIIPIACDDGMNCICSREDDWQGIGMDMMLIDPRVTRLAHPAATAAAAILAFGHAIEVFLFDDANVYRRALAAGAIEQIVAHLLPVVSEKDYAAHQWHLTCAAVSTGCARMGMPAGPIQMMAQALSAHHAIGNSTATALVLPYLVHYIALRQRGSSGLNQLVRPLSGQEIFAATAPERQPGKVIRTLYEWQHQIHLANPDLVPANLAATGIGRDVLPATAQLSAASSANRLATEAYLDILEHAWQGRPLAVETLSTEGSR